MAELHVWADPNMGELFSPALQRHSASELTGKGVFLLFIVSKCRGNKIRLEREGSGILIHGESVWKPSKIKTSALEIRLKTSEKLERTHSMSYVELQN